jgi:hypothetical protein
MSLSGKFSVEDEGLEDEGTRGRGAGEGLEDEAARG